MALILSNADVARTLTMRDTISLLEASYADLASREAVCRPRIDIRIPTGNPNRYYQWGTMEGGSTRGYFAIRMKSDVIEERQGEGGRTQEKFSGKPGLFCGLVLLTSVETGEPLALINDGLMQHMRVGADGAIGVKHMARKDAAVVGMLGSGGMARSHVEAFLCVRPIEGLRVFSPTRAHRERFVSEMRDKHGIEAEACDSPAGIYRGAHIVAALTDSTAPVLEGARLEPGTHIVNIGGGGVPDAGSLARVDRCLRFGSAPSPTNREELALDDEYLAWSARPDRIQGRGRKRGHGGALPGKTVSLHDVSSGAQPGRLSDSDITWSERGNLQGVQFFALAAHVYESARKLGLGRELPTEWLLQDIRD
jgi:ornithine cyclodeaminase/alanine dehydrogenase-like protein (mu-crystallin family)